MALTTISPRDAQELIAHGAKLIESDFLLPLG